MEVFLLPEQGLDGVQVPRTLLRKLKKQGDCILFTECTTSGYGNIRINKKGWLTHRLIYTMLIRPVKLGEDVHHLCGVKTCVNPVHLEAMPTSQHTQLEIASGNVETKRLNRTHCKHGHELTSANTQEYFCRGKYYKRCARCAWLSTQLFRAANGQ